MYRSCVTVLLVSAISLSACVVVPFSTCSGVSTDQCNITNVDIEPCKEAPEACRLKKGSDASIKFDYIPKFTAEKLKTEVVWANGAVELRFVGLDSEGCKFTPCPTQTDVNSHFNFTLHVGKKLPRGTYPIKWKLWDEDNENHMCCFAAAIELRR